MADPARRRTLIAAIEKARGSRVLSVVLGDRQNLETRLAPDIIPLAARHLRAMGKQKRVDLFLYTVGGDIMSAYRLVRLIREYSSERFGVIVPFRCQSAGTLVALGADEIIMLPESQLSPVDPSTNGPYNPAVPGVVGQPGMPSPTLPVSVEEVMGYISLAKEYGGIAGEAGLVSVFEKLTGDIRPIALGQVYRARTQIRKLARNLLELHMDAQDGSIDAIIRTLTEELSSHDYLVTRIEAKRIGLKVCDPDHALESAVLDLYDAYEHDLELRETFNPVSLLAQQPQARLTVDRAMVESQKRLDVYNTVSTFVRLPNGQIAQQPEREGWSQVP